MIKFVLNSCIMKKFFLFLFTSGLAVSVYAQTQASLNPGTLNTAVKAPPMDKSPLDLAYFPADYPMLKTQNKVSQAPMIRVIYSRPQVDNREIFGDLVEYDKVWRLGANESTEIELFRDAVIGGKKIPKGRYTIYAIPTETKWTIILNKDTDSWGAFVYDPKKDILRTDVPVQNLPEKVEDFSMYFSKTSTGASLVIAWDKVSVTLPILIK